MSLLKKLFGGGGAAAPKKAEPVVYKDFSITPTPIPEGGTFRLSALIEKQVGGELKTQTIIRADTFDSASAAADAAVGKAKLLIDQVGERLFN